MRRKEEYGKKGQLHFLRSNGKYLLVDKPTWRPYPKLSGRKLFTKVLDWISLLLKPMKVEPDLISFKNINKLTLSEFDSHGTNSYI